MATINIYEDVETVAQILRAYIEEWGHENVLVSVPKDWQQFWNESTLGRVRIEFSLASNDLVIKVDNGWAHSAYCAQLSGIHISETAGQS